MKIKDHFRLKELLKPLAEYRSWEWAIMAVAAVVAALLLKYWRPL
jgi:hypothetical protein